MFDLIYFFLMSSLLEVASLSDSSISRVFFSHWLVAKNVLRFSPQVMRVLNIVNNRRRSRSNSSSISVGRVPFGFSPNTKKFHAARSERSYNARLHYRSSTTSSTTSVPQ